MKRGNQALWLIIGISIVASVAMILIKGPQTLLDTDSYLAAWKTLSEGRIDVLRTPVYPAFLGFCQTVFGEKVLYGAVIIQYLVFLFAVRAFYILINQLCDCPTFNFYTTLFFAVAPCFLMWNNYVMTESFAISLVLFLLLALYRIETKRKWSALLTVTVTLLLLVFLRPSFIYLLPVLLLAFILLLARPQHRGIALGGIGSVVVTALLYAGYCHAFQRQYGVFAPSNVSLINSFYMARFDAVLDTAVISSPDVRQAVAESYRKEGTQPMKYDKDETEIIDDFYRFQLSDIRQAISTSVKAHPTDCLKRVGARVYYSAKHSLFSFFTFGPNLGMAYSLLIITGILLFFILLKHGIGGMPWTLSIAWMCAAANAVTMIVGAQAEWHRLFMPVVSIILILTAWFWVQIKQHEIHNR